MVRYLFQLLAAFAIAFFMWALIKIHAYPLAAGFAMFWIILLLLTAGEK